jgi:hypothetical protein
MALLLFLAPAGFAAGDPKPPANAAAQTGAADRFGTLEAAGLRWLHLSSRHGDLPVPTTSRQQTAAVVADLDKDGLNDFVLAFREKGPALVWYRRTKTGWDRYVIEKEYLTIEAGGAVWDIDGDGNLDIFVAEMAKWTESRTQPDNPKAQALIFYGDGKGNFRKTVFQTGKGFHEARVADLNGDGKPDILSKPYNWDTPRVDVWLNEGAESWRAVEN